MALAAPAHPDRAARTFVRAGWTCAAVVSILGMLGFVAQHPKDDVAWLVYLAGRMLDGARLYLDLVEINPPLVILLSTPPVAVARWLGVPALTTFYTTVALLLVLCAGIVAHLLHGQAPLFGDRLRTGAFLTILLALAPGIELGQREHLFAALSLPYLALLARRLCGIAIPAWPATAVGLLAGIGFALKPHFLLALVLVEVAVRKRRLWLFRAETIAVALVLVLYGLAVLVLFPAYLTEAVPLAIAHYGPVGVSVLRMLQGAWYLIVLASVELALRRRFPQAADDPLSLLLGLLAIATAAIYVVQWKGWPYHALPCLVALTLLATYRIARASAASARDWLAPALLGTLLIGLAAATSGGYLNACRKQVAVHQLADLIRQQRGHSLLVLSRSLSPAFPVVNLTGVRWTSRYDSVWALVAEASLTEAGGLAAGARPVLRAMVQDFVDNRPQIVAIDARHEAEYMTLFWTQPDFVRAWPAYHEIPGVTGFRVFTSLPQPPRGPRRKA